MCHSADFETSTLLNSGAILHRHMCFTLMMASHCAEVDYSWTHDLMGLTCSQSLEVIVKTESKYWVIRERIVSHCMNTACVSSTSASASGEIRKSLACQNIPEGVAKGTYSYVHRGSTSAQCDASITSMVLIGSRVALGYAACWRVKMCYGAPSKV